MLLLFFKQCFSFPFVCLFCRICLSQLRNSRLHNQIFISLNICLVSASDVMEHFALPGNIVRLQKKKHSKTLALFDVHEKISSAIERGELAVGVFLDLSKAFDAVIIPSYLINLNIMVYVAWL